MGNSENRHGCWQLSAYWYANLILTGQIILILDEQDVEVILEPRIFEGWDGTLVHTLKKKKKGYVMIVSLEGENEGAKRQTEALLEWFYHCLS